MALGAILLATFIAWPTAIGIVVLSSVGPFGALALGIVLGCGIAAVLVVKGFLCATGRLTPRQVGRPLA